jgi:hypothetical protein
MMASEEVTYFAPYVRGNSARGVKLTPSSPDFKNGWSYVSTPPIWPHVVQLTDLSSAVLTSGRDVDNSFC